MDNKLKLLEFLRSQRFITLATYSDKISVCGVFYAVDENFNLYFVSEPTTHHSKNIKANGEISCVIADSHQTVLDKKVGAQIQGKASEVTGKIEAIKALKLWNEANPGLEKVINFKNLKKAINSRVYKIEPQVVKFFNEELYGEEGLEIFNF